MPGYSFQPVKLLMLKCMFYSYFHKNKCPGSYCIDFLSTITMGVSAVHLGHVMVGLITWLFVLLITVYVEFGVS